MIYVISNNPQILRLFQNQDLIHTFRNISRFEFENLKKHDLKINDMIFIDFNIFISSKNILEGLNHEHVYLIYREQKNIRILHYRNILNLNLHNFKNWISRNLLKEKAGDEKIPFIVKDKAMESVLKYSLKIAKIDAPVLITGETGTGKEFVARYIYENSRRSSSPFIVVNCAAIPSSLIETELFGYRKGAFTGATRDYDGKFMQAHNGTLFLDEIAEIPLDLQPKLLRVLDYGEVEMIGDPTPRKINIRLITATNKNLLQMMEEGTFREDLYYRINNFQISIPPLRERKDDIPELFHFYLDYFQKKYRKFLIIEKKDELHQLLLNYSWPGNVRELRNLCLNLVVLNETSSVSLQQVQEYLEFSDILKTEDMTRIKKVRWEKEKETILVALKAHEYNIVRTAKYLGITRQHLYRKMKEYQIERPKKN
jgi:two-component system response regulator AtoC